MTNVGEGGTHFKLTPSSSISKTLIADVKYGEKKLPKDIDTNKQKLRPNRKQFRYKTRQGRAKYGREREIDR